MKIVYRDEIEIDVCRRILAGQTSRPHAKREERAGAEPEPLATSYSGRHEERLSRRRSNTSRRPVIFAFPYPEGVSDKSQIPFEAIIRRAVRAQRLQPYRRFDHLVVLHRWLAGKGLSLGREEALRHLLATLLDNHPTAAS